MSYPSEQYELDRALTQRNRERLGANANLLLWYHELYKEQFRDLPDPDSLRILEIGSGVSPLKRFHKNVLTSDVLTLDHLDFVFDCHEIDKVAEIADESLDVITLTNVLHHVRSPIEFMVNAAAKLKPGGRIIATEPFFSTISSFVYCRIHHEPVDFEIKEPVLAEVTGPLASANIALPWLIFYRHPEWIKRLASLYHFDAASARPFTSLSYMITGGISRRLPIPGPVYRLLFAMDIALSRLLPKLSASFFTITLTKK